MIRVLQEVQSDHWKQVQQQPAFTPAFEPNGGNIPVLQWLAAALKTMGYDSVYAEKTREAMGAEGQVDGCALCWRSDKFFLRDSRVVSFNAKAMMLEEQLPKCVASPPLIQAT